MNYTYILECSDGTYYTGWTNDLEKRVKMHNAGKGAKSTEPQQACWFWHITRLRRRKRPCAGSGRLNS